MKRIVGVMVIGTALLAGCSDNNPSTGASTHVDERKLAAAPDKSNPSPDRAIASPTAKGTADEMDQIVAKVGGEPITMRQLVDPLVEAHGLSMLVSLVELELAKQNAAKPEYHAVVTQKDFDDEHDRTLEKMFKDSDDPKLLDALDKAMAKGDDAAEAKIRAAIKLEREDYLTQFLINQHIDRIEFDTVLKTNTYLRKILDSQWKGKITEKDIRSAFGQMYGERVQVEYIELANMNEVGVAQRRLQAGDSFEDVARDMSHDNLTAPSGGLLPPFSREVREDRVAPAFREAAFNLRDGQVSDVVTVKSSFMLIKRVKAFPPQAVKYESVRDIVYRKLYDALMEAGLKAMKKELAVEAHQQMVILNPVLLRQVKENADRQAKADQRAHEELDRQQKLRDMMKKGALTQPSDTQPTPGTVPATTGGAAPQAPSAAAGERPPATQPGPDAHGFVLPRLSPDTQPSVVPNANK